MTPEQHKQMDAKNYPVWGGLSALNVEAIWNGVPGDTPVCIICARFLPVRRAHRGRARVGGRRPAHRRDVPHERVHPRGHRAHQRAIHDLRAETAA
jgi:hypothetical protein